MKSIIKKNWHVTALAVFIAVYESSNFFFGLDFIPDWVKAIVGVIAFIGIIAKNIKSQK